jgi:hypothetical protein
MSCHAGKLSDQTAKNDDISVELLNLISEKKQARFSRLRAIPLVATSSVATGRAEACCCAVGIGCRKG